MEANKMYRTNFMGYPYEWTEQANKDSNKIMFLMMDEIKRLLNDGYTIMEIESLLFGAVSEATLSVKLDLMSEYEKSYKEKKIDKK